MERIRYNNAKLWKLLCLIKIILTKWNELNCKFNFSFYFYFIFYEKISAAVCFLLSPASSFITGDIWRIDGAGSIGGGHYGFKLGSGKH